MNTDTRDPNHVPAGWTVVKSHSFEVESAEHGSITTMVDGRVATKAFAGDEVALSYASDEGYEVEK